MKHSPAGAAYLSACQREQADCALELLNAFNLNAREVQLNHRARPLVDSDVLCIADALRTKHTLRVLNLEENAFGLAAVQSLIDSLVANPGCVRELRLGKNRLRDPAVVILGNALALNGAGLKVLDVSENSVTKLGVVPLCQALSSKFCDLVEVSLHNNALEADAALPLSQAMRQSNKLKHLHLGYNSLRDSGAVQLARSIPIASSLATLDLTANRIGPQGGTEIAKALLSPNCTLQRINLRHNSFDDATFEFFGDVIVKNTSLTQLFLGFMRPSREVAAQLIATLRYNRSIVLFDMYGWGVEPNDAWGLFEVIFDSNTTLRAIITESCDSIASHIENANNRRESAGLHRIYVGSEDRLAYQSAAAAKASTNAAPLSATNRGNAGTPEPPPYQTSRSASAAAAGQSAAAPSAGASGRSSTPQRIPSTRAIGSTTPRGDPMTPIVHSGTYDKDVDVLLQELQDVHMDSELRRKLVFIISQLQVKMDTLRSYHQQQLAAIEERIRVCELKPACQCSGNHSYRSNAAQQQDDAPSTTFFVAEGRSSTTWNPVSGTSTPSQSGRFHQLNVVPNNNPRTASSAAPARDASPAVKTNTTVAPFVNHGVVVPPPAESIPHTRANLSPNRSGKLHEVSGADESAPRVYEQTQSPARRNSDIPPGPNTRPLSPPPRDRRRGHGEEVHDGRESPRNARDESPQRGSPRRVVVAPVASYAPQDQTSTHTAAAASGRGPSGAGRPPVSTSAAGSRSASYTDAFATNPNTSSRGGAPRSSSTAFSPHLPAGVNTPPAVATPPSEPVDIRENSPANALLQSSQHRPPTTFIEASPMKQDHPRRKLPPMSA
jgi:hypothetical protein